MFFPLNMASLGSIPKADVGAATALYNLTRQPSGSIGVAMLSTLPSTLPASCSAMHRVALLNNLGITSPAVQTRLAMYTSAFSAKTDAATAKHQALIDLDGAIRIQSSLLSFNDCFYVVAFLIFGTMPLVLLLGKPAKGMKPAAH